MFYLLSMITGILECGWIAFGAVHSMPIWQILCYPLAYHIGNLFPKPFTLNKRILKLLCIISFASGVVLAFFKQTEYGIVFSCIALSGLSAVIQSVRSNLKTDGNRLYKRIFRVGGFVVAPLTVFVPATLIMLISVIAFVALIKYNEKNGVYIMNLQNGYSVVMIFHQLHYFLYAHITLAYISKLLYNDLSTIGVIVGAILFCGTWITYMSVEPFVSKICDRNRSVFFAGHILISALLLFMSTINSRMLFIVLWLVTGLGGGVVYTISLDAREKNCFDKHSMTISENIGHVLGMMIALLVSIISNTHSHIIMLVLASISALMAVITMLFMIRKEKNYENITY